jgi:pimeloyl-ACP methyl ester carboxylesterase
MSAARVAALVAGLLVATLLVVYGTLRAGLWNTDPATARAREAGPPSRFITVSGVPLHLRDEGQGPVLVLLHGSIVNLHEWDLVVDRLKDRYRIVRFDWPPYGLSGPDPTGVYSTPRAAELLAGLVDALGLGRFSLVSTSNGANVALVEWRMRVLQAIHAALLPDYHSHSYYRLVLESTTPPSFHPTAAMVDSIYDADNLPGAAARQRQYIGTTVQAFQTSDVGASAEAVRVPVLIQWCGFDTVISQSAQRTVARFTNAPVELITYPDLGHFPMWENPDRFSRDLARFLERVNLSCPSKSTASSTTISPVRPIRSRSPASTSRRSACRRRSTMPAATTAYSSPTPRQCPTTSRSPPMSTESPADSE